MGKTRVEQSVGMYALQTVQSASDEAMYCTVADAAIYMATAGFLAEANELLACLWSYRWPHGLQTWLVDRALAVLWQATGVRPAVIPFEPAPIDHIELDHRIYMAPDRWATAMPTRPWRELEGTDLLRRSMALAYPATPAGPLPPPGHELEALAGLEKYLADQGERIGWMDAVATCLATELAARNGLWEQATRLAVRWAEDYPRWWSNYIFASMACNRHAAPLLLRGILAAPLGLTEGSCRRYLEALRAAVDARMRRGRALAYGTWPWARLLAAIGRQATKAEPGLYTPEERRGRSLARPPAAEEAIAAAEARLDLRLPPDYRAFLRASNGLARTSQTSPRLLPAEEIAFLRHAADPELFGIYKEYPGDDLSPAMERCLLASDPLAGEMVLLVPPLGEDGPWETWFFASWVPGEVRYPSFRHYLEQRLQDLAAGT